MIGAKRKIKVLVVDDSFLFRKMLARSLSVDTGLQVVAAVSDPYEARDKIIEYKPDVMTLDIQMPKMNGIDFLKRLIPQYPIPVVVVSAISEGIFDALNAGAVDFVSKPGVSHSGLQSFISELIIKIKIASIAKLGKSKRNIVQTSNHQKFKKKKDCIIAIGASTGGTEAIFQVIRHFTKDMAGTVIVQHMPPVFTKMYAERLNNSCSVEVKEAQTGDFVVPGRVLLAPGEHHMELRKKGSDAVVRCYKGEKINGHCPSVDVLFDSIAKHIGGNALGVILTGMGYDGAKGLLRMRQRGAYTIGQDEQSSVVYGMPKVAYDLGAVNKQVSLEQIYSAMISYINSR